MRRQQEVSLAFKRLSIPQKVVFGENIINQMTVAAVTFPTPPVSLSLLARTNVSLRDAAAAAQTGDREKVALMHQAEQKWDDDFDAVAHYVTDIARGAEPTILLSGFAATKGESSPAQIPGPPKDVEAFANRRSGSVHVSAAPAGRDTMYGFIVAKAGAPIRIEGNIVTVDSPTDPVHFVVSSRREMDFDGLKSGTQVAVYLYLSNTAGSGPLSGGTLVYVP